MSAANNFVPQLDVHLDRDFLRDAGHLSRILPQLIFVVFVVAEVVVVRKFVRVVSAVSGRGSVRLRLQRGVLVAVGFDAVVFVFFSVEIIIIIIIII